VLIHPIRYLRRSLDASQGQGWRRGRAAQGICGLFEMCASNNVRVGLRHVEPPCCGLVHPAAPFCCPPRRCVLVSVSPANFHAHRGPANTYGIAEQGEFSLRAHSVIGINVVCNQLRTSSRANSWFEYAITSITSLDFRVLVCGNDCTCTPQCCRYICRLKMERWCKSDYLTDKIVAARALVHTSSLYLRPSIQDQYYISTAPTTK
jgi:hypothetical protein